MALKLTAEPAVEPITLAEARLFLRLEDEAGPEDALLSGLIAAARRQAEIITRRQLITASWELRLDRFPEIIYLPLPPLQSVTTFKYLDAAGVEKSLTENTHFLVDIYSEPARITPAYGEVWPPIYPVMNAVRLVFKAGYGAAGSTVPESIRNWIKAMVATLYEHREIDIVANVTQALTHLQFLDGLLDDYRVWSF